MEERQGTTRSPLSVFISYAHEDEPLRRQIEVHLSLLRRQGLISEWHDREILPGAEWNREIDEHLEVASIILLLISSDFLASDYCYDIEMQRALERQKRGEACVIPIILRPCDWHDAPFGKLQSLPRDGKAVTTYHLQDEAFLSIAQGLRRVLERQTPSAHPASRFSLIDRQDRLRLLKHVRTIWIEGILEHSLHQAALIALDLQDQPDALANPWHLQVQETDLPPHPLPAGTSIVQVYDEAQGELLILGEPGAGKTTLLLELARTLLDRAEADEQHPIPVIFNLSSWASTRQPLSEWLVEELWTKYQIPRKIGRSWLASDQLLPLLDGLDEVAASACSACIKAINAYHLEHRFVPLVTCSRRSEYLAQTRRMELYHAVMVQPLTKQQINEYLLRVGNQLEELRIALREDVILQELATTPLMLNVLTLIYSGGEAIESALEVASLEGRRREVFQKYIERMLQRRGTRTHYTRQQTVQWLSWLAGPMMQQNLTAFYIADLQTGQWLPSFWWRRIQWGLIWLSFALVLPILSCTFGIAVPASVLFIWLSLKGAVLTVESAQGVKEFVSLITPTLLTSFIVGSIMSFILIMLASGFLRENDEVVLSQTRWQAMTNSLLGGLGFIILVLVSVLTLHTKPITWAKSKRQARGIRFATLGSIHSVAFTQLFILIQLVILLVGGFLFQALAPIAGATCIVVCTLINLLVHVYRSYHWIRKDISPEDEVPLSAMVIPHFLHWFAGYTPWNLSHFLDYAAERILLYKIGSSYVFIHRLLLDYFASLEKKES